MLVAVLSLQRSTSLAQPGAMLGAEASLAEESKEDSESALSRAAIAAASTYAVGLVFLQHFESGGTFLSFQPGQVREHFRKIFEGARKGRPLDPARA